MDTPLLLALPRLHAEFLPPVEGCRTLWPGLPARPESAWQPSLPWSPAMAASCLADYERACRDGATGTPVLTLGAEPAPSDLSDAERRALREMAGLPSEEPEQPLRQIAQQVLLLTWLQEKQALEMNALERKISESRRALSGLLSGVTRAGSSRALPEERDLPDWRKTLAAALAFLPDMPDNAVFVISSPTMTAALAEIRPLEERRASFKGRFARFETSELAALCGRSPRDRLKRGLPADQWQRTLTLFLPDELV